MTVAGPGLAAQAMAGGLVDEVRLFLVPVLVGGGTKALPDRVRRQLRLDLTRTFADGTVHLRYGVIA